MNKKTKRYIKNVSLSEENFNYIKENCISLSAYINKKINEDRNDEN